MKTKRPKPLTAMLISENDAERRAASVVFSAELFAARSDPRFAWIRRRRLRGNAKNEVLAKKLLNRLDAEYRLLAKRGLL